MQVDFVYESSPGALIVWDGERYVKKNTPIYGAMSFSAYKPNTERTCLEKFASYSCRQDEFVSLLKTGTFFDENGELITLKKRD